MDFVKAKEMLSAIEKLDANSQETIFEALNVAEHIESSSKEIYEKEAEKNKGNELQGFFVFLVGEETIHLNKILELKKMLNSGKITQIVFPKHYPKEIHAIPVGKDQMTALLYSLWREKKAFDFYSEAAGKTKGKVKTFFDDLAEFEKSHVEMFEQYIEGSQNADELIMG